MADVSPRARANAATTLILNKIPFGEGTKLAEQMGISDKDLSEIKNKSLAPALYLLAHLGFKIVPVDAKCLSQVSYNFLMALHDRVTRKAPTLCWDDSEHGAVTEPGGLDER